MPRNRLPRSRRPAPPEEMLAARLIAQRRTNDLRLGPSRQGYGLAALSNGYGMFGVSAAADEGFGYAGRRVGIRQPTSVEGLAGWIVWHAEAGEMWG